MTRTERQAEIDRHATDKLRWCSHCREQVTIFEMKRFYFDGKPDEKIMACVFCGKSTSALPTEPEELGEER